MYWHKLQLLAASSQIECTHDIVAVVPPLEELNLPRHVATARPVLMGDDGPQRLPNGLAVGTSRAQQAGVGALRMFAAVIT